MKKKSWKSKNKKNPSQPKPDGLKPKAIKWKKKLQVEKQKKSIKASTRGFKSKGNNKEKEAGSQEIQKIHQSLNRTALNQRQ